MNIINLVLIYFLLSVESSFVHYKYIQKRDPEMHRNDVTFGRLTFLKGQLFDEQYLSKNGQCTGRCSDYEDTYYHHNEHYNKSIVNKLFQCNGRIVKCKDVVNFDATVTLHVDNMMYRFKPNKDGSDFSVRKAEGLHDRQHHHLYKDHDLYTNYPLSSHSRCVTCKCYCDDTHSKKSVRSFCLDTIQSLVEEGYVITGLRLVIRAKMVHLEIQQGQLVNGLINQSTVHWSIKNWCTMPGPMNYNSRAFQLDEVILPEDQVLTGVQFNRYDPKTKVYGFSVGRFSLGAIGTTVDSTGNLDIENWFPHHKIQGKRKVLLISDLNISLIPPSGSEEISTPNKHYIKFHPSDWKYDFAQHMIPFLDFQEVVTEPASPISGAGIYYKSRRGFGGFIAPKIIVKTN
ncbi:Protein of unknown function [Cotesia congregata]|uniref:Uncharacterized protein n=1 Tax=Cotesia congregata TaxID=51543 RepID=A0A8J2E1T1_COTCN|nr:Protein of unknown function [Cotesia congregata]